MAPVYERLQNAYAESLVVAGPEMRGLLIATQTHLDQLVWASWEGNWSGLPDDIAGRLMDAMQAETMAIAAER